MPHATQSFFRSTLLGLAATALVAQSGPMPPPPLIQIAREELKPGHGAAHAATESSWSRIMRKAKSTDYYLGMSSVTGPSEAWFLMSYGSYADYEAKQNELDKNPAAKKEIDTISQADGEHLTGVRTILAKYRKELSYGPDVEIGKMRSFRIRSFRIKQGHWRSFEDGVKAAMAAYKKSEYPASFAFYEVTAGMGSPSYLVLRPLKSLAELDATDAADKAFQEALGEEGQKTMSKVFSEDVNAVENQLFSFNPKLSFVGPKTLASDPAFWTLKPAK